MVVIREHKSGGIFGLFLTLPFVDIPNDEFLLYGFIY